MRHLKADDDYMGVLGIHPVGQDSPTTVAGTVTSPDDPFLVSEPDRAYAPVPVQPWRIGDAGRAFDEVQPLFGMTPDAPDTVLDGGWIGPLAVYAASVRGLKHRYEGTPRQDAYAVATTDDGRWLVLTVADGVSSGPHSQHAAQLVARKATQWVSEKLDRRDSVLSRAEWYDLFTRLAQTIVRKAGQILRLPPEQVSGAMATTATIVVCATRPADGKRLCQVAWIGDSPAWAIDGHHGWHCLTEVKGAGQEVSSSAVSALPGLPPDEQGIGVEDHWLPAEAVLLAMTDGVGDPLGDGTNEVAQILGKVWSSAPASTLDFALQVGFGRRSFDDDRTVVGVWDTDGNYQ